MNASITLNSIVFDKQFDENGRGVRQSVARGINTPDIMTVQNQEFVDSETKVAGKRSTIRFDAYFIDSITGKRFKNSVHIVQSVAELSTGTQFSDLVVTARAGIASTSPNYLTQALNGEV